MRTRVVNVDAAYPDAAAIDEAAAVLARGGLVAFPTETVYGLGADAVNEAAVAAMFRAKGRPPTDPVIVHLASSAQLREVAREIPDVVMELAREFWPGPLTLLLVKQSRVPDAVTAGLPTVGVRVPSHPVAARLLGAAGVPVAAPSANRFSRPSPTSARHVLADLDGAIDLVLDAGATPLGVESTILDLTTRPPLIRRPGGVSIERLRAVVPDVSRVGDALGVARPQPAPGQLLRHYAPRATLTLYLGAVDRVAARMATDARAAAASGSRVGVLAPREDLEALAPRLAAAAAAGRVLTQKFGSRREPETAARELFAALRDIDESAADVILASAPVEGELAAALIDRLTRAAEGRVVWVG